MKQLYITFSDCGEDGFEFLENTGLDIDIIDRGQMYFNDMATGARILSSRDELVFPVTPEQETLLILRFGDKIHELV
jgi:hypothetical protein